MRVSTWHTRVIPTPEFEQAWQTRLALSRHAHFAMDLRFLAWEGRHGRFATAALVEDGNRRGALVVREEGGARVCGWPWRWEVALEDAGRSSAAGLSSDDCDWTFAAAERLSGGHRLRCFLPAPPRRQGDGFLAGTTLLRSLELDDDGFLRTMDVNKRRAVKRAQREGFEIVRATTLEQFRAFARVQRETERRRGQHHPEIDDQVPEPGEGWREWEHPWMLLLLVVRGGVVEGGSGYGVAPGGMMDYRANASTLDAKRLGGNAQLAFEALRRGREMGCRWMNWGGATEFKRELGGERVDLYGRLGGGVVWTLPNQVSLSLRRARPQLGAWWRTLRAGGAGRREG
jgi:hypothetical protein